MTIFIVHFNYYSACEEYISHCLITTAQSSPSLPIYFITPDQDLHGIILPIAQKQTNIRLYLLEQEVLQTLSAKLDSIFYHDGINPKWFDFNSILRHLVVRWFIENDTSCNSIKSFATSDSDIAHYYDYANLLSSIGPYSLMAKTKLCSYFCLWGIESFRKYTDISSMSQYFVFAADEAGRCSDMHLLAYILGNSPLKFSAFNESFGIPLDHLRDFLYYTGSWLDILNDNTYSAKAILNEYPKGPWLLKSFLECVSSSFSHSLESYVNNHGERVLFMKSACITSLIQNLNSSDALVDIDKKSNLKLYGASIHKYYIDRCKSVDRVRIPYIHFQGASKQLVSNYASF